MRARSADSTGLDPLLRLRRRVQADGSRLVLTGLRDQARDLPHLTDAYALFGIGDRGPARPRTEYRGSTRPGVQGETQRVAVTVVPSRSAVRTWKSGMRRRAPPSPWPRPGPVVKPSVKAASRSLMPGP